MEISLNLYNEDGKINSEKLAKATDAILKGIARINTLSLREEQGRSKGGRRNVEASLLLAADRRAGRSRQENNSHQEIIERQENLLRNYAKEKGIWFSEAEIKENSLIQLPSGFESNVYVDPKGVHVIKVIDYRILDNTPQSFIDNRISLYNSEFQETFYELIGFTENNGRFKFIVKQSYIHARSLDFNTESDLIF